MTWLWGGGGGELPYPLQWLRMGLWGKGLHLCSEWGGLPPPTVHRCRWLAGLPRLSTPLSPARVSSSSGHGCYGASFLLLVLAGRPGRARGGRGTAAYTRGESEEVIR